MIPAYVIDTPEAARALVARIAADASVHALDFETTGLHPRLGAEVRLTAIAGPTGSWVIDHTFAGPFRDYARDLAAACEWAVFNAGFEGRFFDAATGGPDVVLYDVGILSKAKLGGRPLALADMAKRDLDLVLDKELQASDWSQRDLTPEQYAYARSDADVTWRLWQHWSREIEGMLWHGFTILNDAWRGTAEMEDTGMTLDLDWHGRLVAMWERRRNAAEAALRRLAPPDLLPNQRSRAQVTKFLREHVLDEASANAWPQTEKTGQFDLTRGRLRQISYMAPYPLSRWLAALMVFNRADKYLSTYGETLAVKQRLSEDGRIRGRFNIAQAVTGRYSSSGPNLQNIPRNPMVRRAFVAPPGTVMVLADYSSIELRVLAELSRDQVLREAVIHGDVHAENAAALFRVPRHEFFERLKAKDPRAKEMRSRAKAFSFQLIYGAGPGALAVVMRCSADEAIDYINRWAKRHPRAFEYRQRMFERMQVDGFLPCASGRTIYVRREERTMPVASNYPIQGSAADVMYALVARLERRAWMEPALPYTLLASVHDEMLLLTLPEHGEAVQALLQEEMTAAWLDIFPDTDTHRLHESAVGLSWAAKA
jgi:DNA polymerase-1